MNDKTDHIIVDTATRIFQDLCEPNTVNEAEQGVWPKALWNALEESGLTLTWVPEELGGAGAALADGFAVLRAAGRAGCLSLATPAISPSLRVAAPRL